MFICGFLHTHAGAHRGQKREEEGIGFPCSWSQSFELPDMGAGNHTWVLCKCNAYPFWLSHLQPNSFSVLCCVVLFGGGVLLLLQGFILVCFFGFLRQSFSV